MKYEDLDPILEPWAKSHGLTIFTRYRDDEVRMADIVDDVGNIFGIAVWPHQNGVRIGVGDRRTKGRFVQTDSTLAQLPSALERAYAQVEEWINASGNTRTPVR
jgi:hypothetical protein